MRASVVTVAGPSRSRCRSTVFWEPVRSYTFDATQAEPQGGRIVLAYGRDAADVAFLSNYGPLEVTEMAISVDELKAVASTAALSS